jgi:hypothetical protein
MHDQGVDRLEHHAMCSSYNLKTLLINMGELLYIFEIGNLKLFLSVINEGDDLCFSGPQL